MAAMSARILARRQRATVAATKATELTFEGPRATERGGDFSVESAALEGAMKKGPTEKNMLEPCHAPGLADTRSCLGDPPRHAIDSGGSLIGATVAHSTSSSLQSQGAGPSASGEPHLGGQGTVEADTAGIWVGGERLHHSHSLREFPDLCLWACTTCGLYAALAARELRGPCGPLTPRGRNNLARLDRGLWPHPRGAPAEVQRLIELRLAGRAAGLIDAPDEVQGSWED